MMSRRSCSGSSPPFPDSGPAAIFANLNSSSRRFYNRWYRVYFSPTAMNLIENIWSRTVTWAPIGGILIFWWKSAHAAIASGCVTGFWHTGSRTKSPNWPFTLAVFIILVNCGSTLNRIWKSPSGSTLILSMVPVTVLHSSTIWSLVGLYTRSQSVSEYESLKRA